MLIWDFKFENSYGGENWCIYPIWNFLKGPQVFYESSDIFELSSFELLSVDCTYMESDMFVRSTNKNETKKKFVRSLNERRICIENNTLVHFWNLGKLSKVLQQNEIIRAWTYIFDVHVQRKENNVVSALEWDMI